MKKNEELILCKCGESIVVPPTKTFFYVKNHFKENSQNGLKISFLGKNFKKDFLEKIEEPFMGSRISPYSFQFFTENLYNAMVINSIGGRKKAETTLTEMCSLLSKKPTVAEISLDYNNFFYVRNQSNVLCVIWAYWVKDGWYIESCNSKHARIEPLDSSRMRVFFRNV